MRKIDIDNPDYRVIYEQKEKKFEVIHKDNGTLIGQLDSIVAAKAIAQLACLGHLRRSFDGDLYIDCYDNGEDVVTMEEFMESLEDLADDDGPEIEDDKIGDSRLCPPTDGLEFGNASE